jgi:hypothetical protein
MLTLKSAMNNSTIELILKSICMPEKGSAFLNDLSWHGRTVFPMVTPGCQGAFSSNCGSDDTAQRLLIVHASDPDVYARQWTEAANAELPPARLTDWRRGRPLRFVPGGPVRFTPRVQT